MTRIKFLEVFLFFILALPVAAAPSFIDLKLSENEREWLRAHPTVSFTGDPNWLPYEAFDSKGKYIGIVASHLELIEKSTGLKFSISPSKTWTESKEKARQGRVDVLSETDDSDLKSHLNFTTAYISNPIVIAMRSKENYVESIGNIKKRKIALIKDYGYTSKIRRKYNHINFITVEDIQDGLISVSTGKVDALLCTIALCSYTISELGLNNVKITGKTEFDTKLALGVQKNLPELLSILNKAIATISREQQQTILDSWIKNKFPEKTDYALAFKVVVVAAIVLIIFGVWIRRLSKEINLRIETEKELRFLHQRLMLHRENTPLGVVEWNRNFEFVDWNLAAERIFGYTKKEVLGCHVTEKILPENARPEVDKIWNELIENKTSNYSLNNNITKDGRTITCEWYNTPLIDEAGNVIGVTSLVDDITERQKNEESLRQTQKMDAIGNLTGGIAHDFNNMLGVILGFTELMKDRISKDDLKQIKYCDEVYTAAERAKKLTSKLLDFSREGPASEEKTNINNLLNSMQHMLEKTLTHRIKLIYELEQNIWPVMLDKMGLEDALLNMCVNAMHAIAENGTLILKTYNIHMSDDDVKNMDINAGDYVLLSVSDTGAGMSQEIKQKIFDPFFTTKGLGGTGLGMSQVYGFVKQSGADIQLYSEPKQGTQIVIYIPRYQQSDEDRTEVNEINLTDLPSGEETILVVDSEVGQLDLTEEILTTFGYKVLRASNPTQALRILANESVDLILSDVLVPSMEGYKLAAEAQKKYPDVKIQMISGFTDERKLNRVNPELHEKRLHKPVSAEELLMRIRKLLDE